MLFLIDLDRRVNFFEVGMPPKKTARSDGEAVVEEPSLKRARFDPSSLGLSEDFILTDFTRLKGCSCKIPQPKLLELLRGVEAEPGRKDSDVGMDCSIVPITSAGAEQLFLISTTDFFFPSVEDPYTQGRIGAANVLSDLYSMGITKCDTLLMLLGASTDMEQEDRYKVTLEMMKGFNDVAQIAGTSVTGGQSVLNPWPLIGGVGMAVLPESCFIRPVNSVCGDIYVLTKPLGHQLAVNIKQWSRRPSPLFKAKIEGRMTQEEIDETYDAAVTNMCRLNLNGARLMLKFGAHACTDVTGFGLLGHANNLAMAQTASLSIEIHTLPILRGAIKADTLLENKYNLRNGRAAETSGGLLVALKDQATALAFCDELARLDPGSTAWIVGRAIPREQALGVPAFVSKNANILEVVQLI